ncbi:MAG: O-methyltransferase [Nevskiales bacterium]
MKVSWRRVAAALVKFLARRPLGKRLVFFFELERGLCSTLVPQRMGLREVPIKTLFPDADDIGITVDVIPEGDWSCQMGDLIQLLKLVRLLQPQRVLELGSFRGYTAAYIARNLPAGGRVVAVDIDPEHGSAYRGTAQERSIERRTGAIADTLFNASDRGSYDLVFIDADHRYAGVRNDTEVALKLVSPRGYIAWHDYANFGYFNGICQVPEYLTELARSKPLVNLAGTTLALYSPAWESGSPGEQHHVLQQTGRS